MSGLADFDLEEFSYGRVSLSVASGGRGLEGTYPPVYLRLGAGTPAYAGSVGEMYLSRKQTKQLIKVLRRLLKEAEA